MRDTPHLVIYPTAVTKIFDLHQRYKTELMVYKLNIPHVPQMLSHGEACGIEGDAWYITIQRIKGKPYLDEETFNATRLGAALADFHGASLNKGKCLCHIDNQPKNILVSGSDFFFVDFSDSIMDFPETDITHLLLFWAEEVAYLDFIGIAGCFLNSYQQRISLDPKRWRKALKQSITRFDERRLRYNKKAPARDSGKNRNWLEAVV
jgi:thiamine kinase-like enzyme